MSSHKSLIFSLVGILLIGLVAATSMSKPTVENWWGGLSFKQTAVPAIKMANGQEVAAGGNFLNPNMGSGKFFSTPNFQGILAPRFSNAQYGANIRYNMPDRENMAVPCEPLTFGNMAKENYIPGTHGSPAQQPQPASREGYCGNGNGDAPLCGKGGYGIGHKVGSDYEVPPGYTNGNWQQVFDSLPAEGQNLGSSLPIGTMSTMDASGNVDQFVAFNRIMVANNKSRLRSLGDPIRGDLAIVPCQTGWFSVYPQLNIDLQAGAMRVMNGDGASNNDLLNLMVQASGSSQSSFSGVNLSDELTPAKVNMAGSSLSGLSQAVGGTVNVSAFP